MNCTCRQFCASSCPVLSKESAVNFGGLPSSMFHSLHATSHALQPMQIEVSVKKPSASCLQAISLKPHHVAHDLRVAALGGNEVERQRHKLVDDRNGTALLALVDRDDVAVAGITGVEPQMPEALFVGE